VAIASSSSLAGLAAPRPRAAIAEGFLGAGEVADTPADLPGLVERLGGSQRVEGQLLLRSRAAFDPPHLVHRRHAVHWASGQPIFDTEVDAQGQVPSRRMLKVGRTEAPPDIAQWLQVEPGESVVIRSRSNRSTISRQSFHRAVSHFGLPRERAWSYRALCPEGPDNAVEDLGFRFAHGAEVLSARMPMPEEAQILRLPPGVPVVRLLHIDYDDQDRTLQVADDLYVGDRHEFVFEWAEQTCRGQVVQGSAALSESAAVGRRLPPPARRCGLPR